MIKTVIRFFILFLLLILPVNAEELLDNARYFNAYENPVYYKYFDDYMNILGNEFAKIKFFRSNICVQFEYKIYKDGTIGDIKIDPVTNSPKNAEKLKLLLVNNLPPKFYSGMDKDYLNIEIFFGTNRFYDEYTIDFFPDRVRPGSVFTITMDRHI